MDLGGFRKFRVSEALLRNIVNPEVLRTVPVTFSHRMGGLSCCPRSTTEEERLTPSIETKRQQQAEAAERRIREQEARGIKDPEKYKQKLRHREELEKKQEQSFGNYDPKLTWTVS